MPSRCAAMKPSDAATPTPSAAKSGVPSSVATPLRSSTATPSAVKASCARSSSVTSTIIVAKAGPIGSRASIRARTPIIAPPATEIGSSSPPASRRMRADRAMAKGPRLCRGRSPCQARPQKIISTRCSSTSTSSPRQPTAASAASTGRAPNHTTSASAAPRPPSAPRITARWTRLMPGSAQRRGDVAAVDGGDVAGGLERQRRGARRPAPRPRP